MTPTPEALAAAARALKSEAHTFAYAALIANDAKYKADSKKHSANLSAVAAWLETQGWRDVAESVIQQQIAEYQEKTQNILRAEYLRSILLPKMMAALSLPTPPETPDAP